MPNEMEALEIEDVASLLGVSVRMVRNYIADNKLPCRTDGRKKLFVWSEVREWYVAYRIEKDGSRGSLAPQIPVKEDINAAILRKTVAEADLKELELAKQRGQVAAIIDVERVLAAATMAVQTQILAVPSRLATQMLGIEEHGRAVAILEAEMRQLLTNLAGIDAIKEATGISERRDEDEE